MFDLRKLFLKEGASPAHGDCAGPGLGLDAGSETADGLEIEYQRLVSTQFRRLGIHEDCTTIEVRRVGKGPHGFDVLVGMVRLHRWERTSALRLLIGLPLIESRVRKLVRSTWLADYSHFGGLWLHTSEHLHEAPGMEELRDLLMTLTPPDTPPDTPAAASAGVPPSQAHARPHSVAQGDAASAVPATDGHTAPLSG